MTFLAGMTVLCPFGLTFLWFGVTEIGFVGSSWPTDATEHDSCSPIVRGWRTRKINPNKQDKPHSLTQQGRRKRSGQSGHGRTTFWPARRINALPRTMNVVNAALCLSVQHDLASWLHQRFSNALENLWLHKKWRQDWKCLCVGIKA